MKLRTILVPILALVFFAGWASAQVETSDRPSAGGQDRQAGGDSAAGMEKIKALEARIAAAREEYGRRYQAAETAEEKRRAYDEAYPKPVDYADAFLAIANAHAGTEAARDALIWTVKNVREREPQTRALDLLVRDFVADKAVGGICRGLRYAMHAGAGQALKTIVAKSPHDEVKGQARYALAIRVKRQEGLAKRLQADPDDRMVVAYEKSYGKSVVEYLRSKPPAEILAEAEKMLQGVVDDYDGSLAESASSDLFEIRNLGIGKVAPDIEGEDIEGITFKLSDYRGKVVVIDFWGDW